MIINLLSKKNIEKSFPTTLLLMILLLGHYLRFYNIENTLAFGWDQGRDAWVVRDILNGNFVLNGPRVGVGDFYLGPAYFYMLAPLYYFTRGDPMAANYFNMLVNIFNITTIYYVSSRLFNVRSGLIAAFIFSLSAYAIGKTMVPWNVSPIPGVSILIFYALYQIVQIKFSWIYPLALLTGLSFHLHFTAIFLPVIYTPVFFIVEHKVKLIKHIFLSLPLFLIWLLPTIVRDTSTSYDNYYRFTNFLRDYFIGFHLRFMLHRLPDSLIQIQGLLTNASLASLKYILLPVFFTFIFFEKKKGLKTFGLLVPSWFVVPLVGFTLYGGPISDYYFFLNFSIAILIFIYFIEKLLGWRRPLGIVLISIILCFYAYANTFNLWIKTPTGGLSAQKKTVVDLIKSGGRLDYKEGDINSYLYITLTENK